MGALGIIAGIHSDKVDELAAFQNFIILPLTFLSGVFYSIHSLPPVWQAASHLNPIFYMVDGLRFGMLGVSDAPPWAGAGLLAVLAALAVGAAYAVLRSGYRLRG